jgi:hypothetical protein
MARTLEFVYFESFVVIGRWVCGEQTQYAPPCANNRILFWLDKRSSSLSSLWSERHDATMASVQETSSAGQNPLQSPGSIPSGIMSCLRGIFSLTMLALSEDGVEALVMNWAEWMWSLSVPRDVLTVPNTILYRLSLCNPSAHWHSVPFAESMTGDSWPLSLGDGCLPSVSQSPSSPAIYLM